MEKWQLTSGSNLSYLGDAYLELRIRKYLLDSGITNNKELNKCSLNYVSASAHQNIYFKIKDEFSEEEQKIFLRGRNGASHNHRKNMRAQAYGISSGLEAVIGYLYLKGDEVRLNQIITMIIQGGQGEC